MRDETQRTTEVEIAAGNSMRPVSTVGTHLCGQEVASDVLLKNEANTQELESDNWIEQNMHSRRLN